MSLRVCIVKALLVATCSWLAAVATAASDAPSSLEGKGIKDFQNREPKSTCSSMDETACLRIERYNAALLDFRSRYQLLVGGKSTFVDVQAAAQRLMDSELVLAESAAVHKRVIAQYLALSEDLLRYGSERYEKGIVPKCDCELMRQWHLAIKIKAASPDFMVQDDQGGGYADQQIKLKLLTLDVQEAALEVDVADTELAEAQAINQRLPGSISAEEIRHRELQVKIKRIALERAKLLMEHHRHTLSLTAKGTQDRIAEGT